MSKPDLARKFNKVKTFIFDIDGVLTEGMITLFPNGEQIRRMNIKDGHAIRQAVQKGYDIVIISRGTSDTVIGRLSDLGVKNENIFLKITDKAAALDQYIKDNPISLNEVLYMGDDIPDYYVMKKCGFKTCPKNSATEILALADYISDRSGGDGCVRDVIEQTLRHQNNWFKPE